jgi:hypothetical protein
MVQLTRKNFFATANAGKLTLLAIVDPAGTRQEGCVRATARSSAPPCHGGATSINGQLTSDGETECGTIYPVDCVVINDEAFV